jgi:environmental stress-induced protein Ves
MPNNVIELKPVTTIKFAAEMSAETAALVNKFVALNQRTRNTHGPLTVDKLVRMLLEDVAAAVKDGSTWQGAHMALVLCEHGYRTGGGV